MINGSAKEFIEGLYYSDERYFFYNGKKYFIQGYFENQKPMLVLYVIENPDDDFEWQSVSIDENYPVEDFENAKIFNGKSLWEAESQIKWLDD